MVFALSAGVPQAAPGDEVSLDNGDRISGWLTGVSASHCQFKTSYEATLRLEWGRVVRLETSRPVTIVMTSGERVVGTLSRAGGGALLLRSSALGVVTLMPEQVATVRPAVDAYSTAPGVADIRGKGAEEGTTRATAPVTQPIASKPLGEQPPEETHRLFLRQAGVLLGPSQITVEAGLSYTSDERVAGDAEVQRRALSTPLTLRLGLFDRAEGFVELPLVYNYEEMTLPGHENADVHGGSPPLRLRRGTARRTAQSSHEDGDAHDGTTAPGDDGTHMHRTDEVGVGDLSAGVKYLLVQESERWPDVVAFLTLSAPTGENPYENLSGFGSGHWGVGGGVQFIRSYDPVVLFGGVGYRYQFERDFDVGAVQPGGAFSYNFGAGFAVSDRITFSALCFGSFQPEFTLDGETVAGSSSEPIALRLALTNRLSRATYLEPSVTFGLNDDAPDVIVGLSLVRRLR